MEKAAAQVLFGTELKSSYEEALTYFHKCVENRTEPWPKNDWMIAQCLIKQKKPDKEAATALIAKIMGSDDGEAFAEEIAAFAKKHKISL
jgi:hypothetical protein